MTASSGAKMFISILWMMSWYCATTCNPVKKTKQNQKKHFLSSATMEVKKRVGGACLVHRRLLELQGGVDVLLRWRRRRRRWRVVAEEVIRRRLASFDDEHALGRERGEHRQGVHVRRDPAGGAHAALSVARGTTSSTKCARVREKAVHTNQVLFVNGGWHIDCGVKSESRWIWSKIYNERNAGGEEKFHPETP